MTRPRLVGSSPLARAAPALGVAAAFALAIAAAVLPGTFLYAVGAIGAAFAGVTIGRNAARAPRRTPVDVDVTDEAIGLRDGATTRRFPRGEIATGLVVPGASSGAIVRLETRWPTPPVVLEFDEADDATALLAKLGLDAPRAVAGFVTASPALTLFDAFFFAALVVPAASGLILGAFHPAARGPAVACGILASTAAALVGWRRGHLAIGVDGIDFGWLWIRAFVRHDDVKGARVVEGVGGLVLEVHAQNGRVVRVPLRGGRDEADRVVERIRQAATAGRGRSAGDTPPLLARGDATAKAHVVRLRALGVGAEAFRSVSVPEATLWDFVLDPSAPDGDRVAAAIALAPKLDEAGRGRVRVAAGAVASPKLRVALLAATGDDDRALERAVDGLGADRSGSTRNS